MSRRLTGKLYLSTQDKHKEMKRVATWTGRNEAGIPVHQVVTFWKMSIKEQKQRQSWREKDRQKGERGSWSHLSSVSSQDFPLCHTSIGSRVCSHQGCQESNKGVLKLFAACLCSRAQFRCADSLSCPPNEIRKASQSLFCFSPCTSQKQKVLF